MSSEASQPVFQIRSVYLKDMSLEQPHSPAIFLEKKLPEIEVSINVGIRIVGRNHLRIDGDGDGDCQSR